MKMIYETAEINVVIFDKRDVITASSQEGDFVPSYSRDDDETEIL